MFRPTAALAALLVLTPPGTASAQVEWNAVDAAFGRSSAAQPDGVHRFSMPRTDLRLTAGGVTVDAGLALGSWLAMKPRENGTVLAMGDLVLLEDEVAPVMSRLQEGGMMPTALHDHLLARGLGAALALTAVRPGG